MAHFENWSGFMRIEGHHNFTVSTAVDIYIPP